MNSKRRYPTSTVVVWILALCVLLFGGPTAQLLRDRAAGCLASLAYRRPSGVAPANQELKKWAQRQKEEYSRAVTSAEKELGDGPQCVCRVIFQGSAPWDTTLWVDAGRRDGIVANSPVLVNDILIGIIDFAGDGASRVRLLSDPRVRPAVRVVRATPDVREVVRAIRSLKCFVDGESSIFPRPELSSTFSKLLDCLQQSLPSVQELFLAKGELQGAEYPSSPGIWKGVGFNYEFDDEGPRRDLRTGQIRPSDQKIALICPGDSLETSGLDGVFPKGLRVAVVEVVFPIEEGAISYTVLARTEAENFPNFEFVTIIPPQTNQPLALPPPEELLPIDTTQAP